MSIPESDDLRMEVCSGDPARVDDDVVTGDDDPVEDGEGEVGFDVEDGIFANSNIRMTRAAANLIIQIKYFLCFNKAGTLFTTTYGDSVAQEFPADDFEDASAGDGRT